jgi:hypothetical protein
MTFDPYESWLGIPASRRPPNYYALIGIADFEENAETIHEAALARVAELRKHQTGPFSDLSQTLMNEVAQARLCLLDPHRKADYDAKLRAIPAAPAESSVDSRTGVSKIRVAVAAALILAGIIGVGLLNVPNATREDWDEPDDFEDALVQVSTPTGDQIAVGMSGPVETTTQIAPTEAVAGNVKVEVALTSRSTQTTAEPKTLQSPPAAGDLTRFFDRAGMRASDLLETWRRPFLPLTRLLVPPYKISVPVSIPAKGTLGEWLTLGPIPESKDGKKEGKSAGERLTELVRVRSRRPIPREGQSEPNMARELRWQRGQIFGHEAGIYLVFGSIRVPRSLRVHVVIESAPGEVVLWFDRRKAIHQDPRSTEPAATEPVRLDRGVCRIDGAIRAADPTVPLIVRLVDVKTNEALPDVQVLVPAPRAPLP